MLMVMSMYFILLVLKQVNAVVDVTIRTIHIQKFMSRTNEARHVKWHKTCKCKSKLDASV